MRLKDINILSVGNTIQMVGAIYAGEGKTLLAYFPGEKEDLPIDILDMDSGDWETFIRQTDLLETEILSTAKDGKLTKIIARKSTRQIDQSIAWGVFRRDGYRCRYCGRNDQPLTIDHLVLWEHNGPTIAENLLSSCKRCNKARGNMLYEEWLQDSRYVLWSKGLTMEVIAANKALVATLDKIPKMAHARSR